MSKPVILAFNEDHPTLPQKLREHFQVISKDEYEANPEKYNDLIVGIETFTTTTINAAIIDRFPNLEIIASSAVGVNNIDLQHAWSKGTKVSYTPYVVTEATANVGIMHLLNLTRKGIEFDQFIRDGQWHKKDGTGLGVSLIGKKIGIVGLGRIGQSVAAKARAFGLEVLYTSRSEKPDQNGKFYDDVVQMAGDSDFLIACCDLNEGTRRIVSKEVLEALGPQGFFINIARGEVVDQEALIAALQAGVIAGAGLDVFDDEPEVPQALIDLDNVTLSPHIGSKDHETRVQMADMTLANLLAHFAGEELPNPVPMPSK